MSIWNYVGIAALSGFGWSVLQFFRRRASKDKDTRWTDFDPFKTGVTCVFNAVGGGAGAYFLPRISDVEPSITLAVASGIVGEEVLKYIGEEARKRFPFA